MKSQRSRRVRRWPGTRTWLSVLNILCNIARIIVTMIVNHLVP